MVDRIFWSEPCVWSLWQVLLHIAFLKSMFWYSFRPIFDMIWSLVSFGNFVACRNTSLLPFIWSPILITLSKGRPGWVDGPNSRWQHLNHGGFSGKLNWEPRFTIILIKLLTCHYWDDWDWAGLGPETPRGSIADSGKRVDSINLGNRETGSNGQENKIAKDAYLFVFIIYLYS